jgi:DNA polymerase-3 subunit gamma/tau
VVFVLATTDPQKVSETIRSRTQHLQFRLLPAKDIEEHVRFVVQDAKLDVTPEAIRQAVEQGGGSARDTLSALELIAAGGGEADVFVRPEDVIESLINHDAAAVLTQVGAAMQRGYDPKAFTEQLVRFLREMFLSSMAPQLVQLAEDHAHVAADMTARYGVASVVRAIEVLGEALVDIRRAPDPRLVLEVTLVRLASNVVANDTSSLLARLERLESGNARPRDVTGPIPRPKLVGAAPSRSTSSTSTRPTTGSTPPTPSAPPVSQTPSTLRTSAPAPTGDLVAAWPGVVRTLKATQRALYSAVEVIAVEGDTLVVSAPSDMHKKKCLELKDHVHAALSAAAGRQVTLDIRVQESRTSSNSASGNTSPTSRRANVPIENNDANDLSLADDDNQPVESVVDQIAKQFPGARIVDTSQN